MHKKRGSTRAKDVWTLPIGQKIVIQCNNMGQPIKKGGGIMGGWLGTVARKKEFCSIEYSSYKEMPKKKKDIVWELTTVIYIIYF